MPRRGLTTCCKRLTFRGDQITTYELGIKTTIGEIDVTAAAYRMNMKDAVISDTDVIPGLIDPETGLNLVNVSYAFARKNAGEAQSTGLELEARGPITDSLSFQLSASWIPDAEVQAQAGVPNRPAGGSACQRQGGQPHEHNADIRRVRLVVV